MQSFRVLYRNRPNSPLMDSLADWSCDTQKKQNFENLYFFSYQHIWDIIMSIFCVSHHHTIEGSLFTHATNPTVVSWRIYNYCLYQNGVKSIQVSRLAHCVILFSGHLGSECFLMIICINVLLTLTYMITNIFCIYLLQTLYIWFFVINK